MNEQNEHDIFVAALEIADNTARARYLQEACAGKPELQRNVQSLLDAHLSAGDFLNAPAIKQFSSDSPFTDRIGSQTVGASADPEKTRAFSEEDRDGDHEVSLGFLRPSTRPGSLGRLGHYEIQKILGQGACGIVFKAFDEILHRTVAIKVMSVELASTSPPRKRFLREARASAAIRHENVVAVYSVEEQPIPYLVMEYIPGLNLQRALDEHGPLDLRDVLRLGQQIAEGLAAAHAQGLIHRDIKPANILLENGLTGRVKITDFGLARASDDASLTKSGTIAGTPMYMSPEQATSGIIDQRSDLFSLGSVLYVMVSGRPPFRASTTLAILKRVVEDTPRPIQEIIPQIPDWLCAIIAKLQAKQPDDRFASASEVAELLGRHHLDTPSTARPVPVDGATKFADSGLPVSARQDLSDHRPRNPPSRWRASSAMLLLLLFAIGITEVTGVTELASTLFRKTDSSSNSLSDETVSSAQPPTAQITDANSVAQGAIDLTSTGQLGTWEMGPEPYWFGEQWWQTRYTLKHSNNLPGLIERPARLPGIRRWNVDTVWNRSRNEIVSYSPNGRWLAACGNDGHVRIYDAESMQLESLLPGMAGEHGVLDLDWHPDSERLAVAADGFGVAWAFRIWSRSGQLMYEDTSATYGSVRYSHSGEWIADGSQHRLVLRRADGTEEKTLGGEQAGVLRGGSIAWSPDDQFLACRSLNGDIQLWNVVSGKSQILVEKTVCWNGMGLAWGKAGWLAVTDGPYVKLFHPEQNESRTIEFAAGATPGQIAWYSDGLTGISTIGTYVCSSWNCDDLVPVVQATHDWQVNGAIAIDPKGRRVAFAKDAIQVYESDLKQVQFRSPTSAFESSTNFVWSRDGQELAGLTSDAESISLWSRDGRRTRTTPSIDKNRGGRIVSGPDGKILLFAGSSQGIWLIERSTAPRKLLSGNYSSVDWSSDGQHVALGTTNGSVVILNQDFDVVAEMKACTGAAQVAWSRDDNLLAVHCGQQVFVCDAKVAWELIPGSETTRPAEIRVEPIWTPNGERFSLLDEGWFDRQGRRLTEDISSPNIFDWRSDGKRCLQPAQSIGSFLPGGTEVASRYFNCCLVHPKYIYTRYNPHGNLIASGIARGAIFVCRESDLQPYLHIVMLPDQQSATFSAAGELLDGNLEAIEKYIVYYVEREEGNIEVLKPSQFRKLISPNP